MSFTKTKRFYLIVAISIVLVVVILVQVYFYFSGSPRDQYTEPIFPSCESIDCYTNAENVTRLDSYCAKHQYLGSEGDKFVHSEYFEMSNLVITTRYGDRSAMFSLPAFTPMKPQYNSLLKPESLQYTKYLQNFRLKYLQSSGEEVITKGEKLSDVYNIKKIFRQSSDYDLNQGQLTSQGFFQQLQLGSLLNHVYRDYFNKIESPKQLNIRATNYARALQSLGGLLITTFPKLLKLYSQPITVLLHKNENTEIMHGVGLKYSSHHIPPLQSKTIGYNHNKTSELEILGPCELAFRYSKRQEKKFKRTNTVFEQMAHYFGSEVYNYSPLELADSVLSSYCHDLPLPCSDPHNSDTCVTTSLVQNIMTEADRFYCARYNGNEGGLEATSLSSYPFLQEILHHITIPQRKTIPNVSIFAGHDTTIAGLLAALGVFQTHPELCQWPGYSSRVIFEVWKPKRIHEATQPVADNKEQSEHGNKDSTAIPPPPPALKPIRTSDKTAYQQVQDMAKTYLTKYPWHTGKHPRHMLNMTEVIHSMESDNELFFRMIYNGVDVTQSIPACRLERITLAKSIIHLQLPVITPAIKFQLESPNNFPLCSANALQQQIKELIVPYQKLHEACAM